jgi:hypothetical protein
MITSPKPPIPSSRSFVPQTALAKAVSFSQDMLQVQLVDGRVIAAPLSWFPLLLNATPEQRNHFQIGGHGMSIHWPDIDEDLSVAGLMAGADKGSA